MSGIIVMRGQHDGVGGHSVTPAVDGEGWRMHVPGWSQSASTSTDGEPE